MRHEINLLRDAPAAPTEGLSLTVAALAPLVCLVLFLAAAAILGVRAGRLEQRINALDAAALQRKAQVSAQDVDLGNVEQRLSAHSAALNALKNSGAGDQSGFGESLRALARGTIEGVWLTGITLEHGLTALHGRATTPPRVSAYLDSLQNQALFAGRSFKALEIKMAKDKDAPGTSPASTVAGLEFQLVSQPDPNAPVALPSPVASPAPNSLGAGAGASAAAGRSAP